MNFFSLFSKNNKSSSSTPNKDSNKLLSEIVHEDLMLQEKLKQLEKQKNLKKQNFLEREKMLKDCEDYKFRQYQSKNQNDKLIKCLLTDDETTNQLVSAFQKDNLQKHEHFLHHLKEVEKSSKDLINNTLNLNQLFQIDFHEKYSKCNSLGHMKSNNQTKLIKIDKELTLRLEKLIEEANVQRCVLVNKVSNNDLSEMEKLTNLLNTSNCYHQVLKEHLKFMYNQLKYLTAVELQKQNYHLNKQINNLSSERITITQLLVDYIDKKKQNQKRLIQELEVQNFEIKMTAEWLSQYSQLINNMPSKLTFSENTINPTLLHRVCTAGGSHLLLFILENNLKLPLTEEYLANMGVRCRKDQDILIGILNHFPMPSAPSESEFSPSAPFFDNHECIVCMEKEFDVLFIPCGHLCCCWSCSEKITLCPMCRTNIYNKFDIKNIM